MKYHSQIILMLLTFTLFIVSIGGVSAAVNTTDNSSVSTDTSESAVNSVNTSSPDDSISQGNSSSNSQTVGNFNNKSNLKSADFNGSTVEELQALINNSNNTVIYLGNRSIVSTQEHYQVNIYNRNLTFCGGYSLDDNKTSSIINTMPTQYSTSSFYCVNSTINFIRVNLINSVSLTFYSGNATLDNCNFYNDYRHYDTPDWDCFLSFSSSSSDYNIYTLNVKNCNFINCAGQRLEGNFYQNTYLNFNYTNCTFINTNSSRSFNYNDFNYATIYIRFCNGYVNNCTFINEEGIYSWGNLTVINSNFKNGHLHEIYHVREIYMY